MIPYGKQDISDKDVEAVVAVLRSDFLTQGPIVPKFEALIAGYCRAHFATAFANATAALHISCLALDVTEGDVVWTSPISFVASANCALYCGATIDFVDIDYATNNICPLKLEEKLAEAKSRNALPKVVIPVHMGGQPCDMKKIFALSQEYGFSVIEDASHAIGASYLSEPVGSGQFSDITVFSFHPVKIITTGEGGIAVTNNQNLHSRMALLRSHGITRSPEQMVHASEGGWYYQQTELGFNYRMTELQAALGVSQFTRLDKFVNTRNQLALNYDKELQGFPIDIPMHEPRVKSSYHLYIVKLQTSDPSLRKSFFDHLRSNGIGVNVHYIPIHLQPYYQNLGFKKGDFPNAERYYDNAISLPLHPNLSATDQSHIVDKIRDFLV